MKKILVADDSPYILEVVSMTLEALDFQVILASDGEETLDQVRKERPDLVILDLMMPKKNGFEVCRELKQNPLYCEIPIVMLSAKAQKEDKYWGRDAGADDYITKPFDPLDLERVVRRILELRETGEGYHPLTKLPTHHSIEKDIERRKEAQEIFSVCQMRFAPEAVHIFQQKYGGIKWEELLATMADIIREQVMRLGGGSCFLGHRGESTFVAVGHPEALERIGKAAVNEVGKALIPFYQEDDLSRGYVLRGEEKHPLLSLQCTISQS